MPGNKHPKTAKIELQQQQANQPASTSSAAPATTTDTQINFRDLPVDLFSQGAINEDNQIIAITRKGRGEILKYLSFSALNNLIAADSRLFRLSREDEGLKAQLQFAKEQVHQLLVHIVNAALNLAENMIKADPGLLLETGQVKDRGYLYKGTALTIALELGDISIHPENEEMADMILRHLRTLPNGEAEIKRQIQTHFPNGFIHEMPYDFTEIYQAIQTSTDADVQAALRKEQNDTPLCKALNKFREEFSNCSRNFCHFLAALTLYDTKFTDFKSWDQRSLFCIQVLGFVQRYLPLCDIYVVKQGIYNVVENKQRLTRDGFEFEDWSTPGSNGTRKIHVFPVVGLVGLGFDFYGGVGAWGAVCGGGAVGRSGA